MKALVYSLLIEWELYTWFPERYIYYCIQVHCPSGLLKCVDFKAIDMLTNSLLLLPHFDVDQCKINQTSDVLSNKSNIKMINNTEKFFCSFSKSLLSKFTRWKSDVFYTSRALTGSYKHRQTMACASAVCEWPPLTPETQFLTKFAWNAAVKHKSI